MRIAGHGALAAAAPLRAGGLGAHPPRRVVSGEEAAWSLRGSTLYRERRPVVEP